jgi:putative transposase
MSEDNLIAFGTESSISFRDALTELVRKGARQIIAQAVEAELSEFLAQYQSLKDEQGRQAVVRNGYLPERIIVTGVGEVAIQVPKVRDRTGSGIKFNSSLLPPYPELTITQANTTTAVAQHPPNQGDSTSTILNR